MRAGAVPAAGARIRTASINQRRTTRAPACPDAWRRRLGGAGGASASRAVNARSRKTWNTWTSCRRNRRPPACPRSRGGAGGLGTDVGIGDRECGIGDRVAELTGDDTLIPQLADASPAMDDEPAPVFEARPEDVGSASYQRLGGEGLVRLRARYAEVMARIAERPLEEEAREELKLRAERLNPDAWVTADEVSAALEQYETVFEGLRGVVGRHPRRRRHGRR